MIRSRGQVRWPQGKMGKRAGCTNCRSGHGSAKALMDFRLRGSKPPRESLVYGARPADRNVFVGCWLLLWFLFLGLLFSCRRLGFCRGRGLLRGRSRRMDGWSWVARLRLSRGLFRLRGPRLSWFARSGMFFCGRTLLPFPRNWSRGGCRSSFLRLGSCGPRGERGVRRGTGRWWLPFRRGSFHGTDWRTT